MSPVRQRRICLLLACAAGGFALPCRLLCQPWTAPLMIANSNDGITFDAPVVFQDSSGVPSAVRWRGDTLVCVFQWCRQPVGSPTWDRVAVKFSSDNGASWTLPQPIVVHDLPPSYQRPFDPTLAVIPGDSLRIYFSSSDGMPPPGEDSLINTYSAISADGVNFFFEPDPRVDHPTNRVIDPAVIHFGGLWHYLSPVGAPQSGAYHYISQEGTHFSMAPNIGSDAQHNWTGNYLVNASDELRFYGTGFPFVWFNSSPNGGEWTGYTNSNIRGGDPTVVKQANGTHLIIFVGMRYLPVSEPLVQRGNFRLHLNYPNPFNASTIIAYDLSRAGHISLCVFDPLGRQVAVLKDGFSEAGRYRLNFDGSDLASGIYFARLDAGALSQTTKLMLLK